MEHIGVYWARGPNIQVIGLVDWGNHWFGAPHWETLSVPLVCLLKQGAPKIQWWAIAFSHQTIAIYWGTPPFSRAYISTYGPLWTWLYQLFPSEIPTAPPDIFGRNGVVHLKWLCWLVISGSYYPPPKYECLRGMPNCAYILNNQQMGWWWFTAISVNS